MGLYPSPYELELYTCIDAYLKKNKIDASVEPRRLGNGEYVSVIQPGSIFIWDRTCWENTRRKIKRLVCNQEQET